MALYLKKINENYYYWRRIPQDLVKHHAGTHIKASLHTKERKLAKMLEASYTCWLDRYISIIRAKCFTFDEIERIKQRSPINLPDNIRKSSVNIENPRRITQLYELYEQEHVRAKRWAEKTKIDQRQMIRIFTELLGKDLLIQNIERSQLLILREQICRLPPNITKDRRFRGKVLSEILKMNYEPMSHVRVYRIVSHLQAFLKWCYKHGHLKEDISMSLSMPKIRDNKQCEERSVYTNEDIKKMFATDAFCGKAYLDRPENFFLPLIAMYTGMRLNEIAQLYIEDVQEVEGIPFISINNEKDKVVKNATSCRIMPIHPMLVKIGFLDYVRAAKHKDYSRLWMCLNHREDSYGKMFSSFFQRLNRSYITDDPRKVFHSFRHGFTSQLKEQGARTEVIAELLGHSHGSITLDRYGKPFSIKTLYESILLIEFSLPMKQLQQTAKRIIMALNKTGI